MSQRILWGLIVVTAAVLALIYAALEAYGLAALAVGLGAAWLVLDVRMAFRFDSAFFLAFVALAILGSLLGASAPLVLLGVSTDLAAWDIARFRARIAGEAEGEAAALLETKHLRKLAVTAGVGFVIALLPVLIQISINFVALLLIILLIMILLRRSMLSLRPNRDGGAG